MKIQLTLLLVVVLLASLPSVVFAQTPLQSGETSQTAKATDIVQKSWKGPFFGLGAGFGIATEESLDSGETSRGRSSLLNAKIQMGYGLSDRTVLYGSVFSLRFTETEDWSPPLGLFGAMWKWGDSDLTYGFAAIGTALSSDGERVFAMRGGYGAELYPGLAMEGTTTGIAVSDEGWSGTIYSASLTFNYHWY